MLSTALAVSDGILDKRLILVGGKGGVGRSALASAIALACARRGRRTLLFEANANDRFGAWFDRPPVGTSIVQLHDNIAPTRQRRADDLQASTVKRARHRKRRREQHSWTRALESQRRPYVRGRPSTVHEIVELGVADQNRLVG